MRQPFVDLTAAGPNTRVSWTYTDGMNNKYTNRSVFAGRIDAGQVSSMTSKLTDDGEFVPDDVGMTMLQRVVNSFFHPTADHAWHTLGGIETTQEEAVPGQNIDELVGRWSAIDSWDPDTAEDKLREQLGPPPEDEDGDEEFDPETFAAPKL